MRKQNLSGTKPFRVLWIEADHVDSSGQRIWRGQCDCGNTVFANTGNTKIQKSCGCIVKERLAVVKENRRLQTETGLKWCGSCKDNHPVADFPSDFGNWDGLETACRKVCNDRSKRWRGENPEKAANCDLKKSTGVTLEQKNKRLEEQGNCCAVCKTTEPEGRYNIWCTDHNHETGKFRGVLCSPCNLTLGNARENVERLRGLADYLELNQSINGLVETV